MLTDFRSASFLFPVNVEVRLLDDRLHRGRVPSQFSLSQKVRERQYGLLAKPLRFVFCIVLTLYKRYNQLR